jgi:DNA-binding NtrC family response regulator
MMAYKILIIDDEEKLRSLMTRIVSLEGYEVLQASDIKSAFKILVKESIDIVLCDVKLPDGNGIDAVSNIKMQFPNIEIILLTAYGNIADGVQAIKNGAFDYITKGDDNDKIIPLLSRAVDKIEILKKVERLEKELGSRNSFNSIIGESKVLKDVIQAAKKVSISDTTVLLNGETGTGKEIFAQSIHNDSLRKNKAFIAVNCAAISKDLLENELFGHKEGAFTGAIKETKGIFEESNNGTVFLDEIGEMSLELQAKMLRVIETGEFYKVGSSNPTKVNVRIIAATNRDLTEEVKNLKFREDLFYRISVFQIKLPSLNERIEDVEELASYFLQIYAGKMKKKMLKCSKEYLLALKNHDWKGNIRELKNVIERSVILASDELIGIDTLPKEFQNMTQQNGEIKQLSAFELASAEKLHILKVLNHTSGNKTEAARLLNIGLTTLYRKLEEYKIQL